MTMTTNPITTPNIDEQNDDSQNAALKQIPITTIIIGVCAFVGTAIWFPQKDNLLGVVFGLILALANFIFLTKIVVKLLNQNYSGSSNLVVLISLKLLFMAGMLYLGFQLLQVNALAFALGYLSLIVAALIHQVKI